MPLTVLQKGYSNFYTKHIFS